MFTDIIFDYDGVLVDSFQFHLDHYNQFFSIDLTPEELRDAHNGNFYDNQSDKLSIKNIEGYVDLVAPDQKTLPVRRGVPETLQALNAQGTRCHLVTSSWQRQCLPNLEHNKIAQYFSALHFADSGFAKHEKLSDIMAAENVAPEDCCFVADTLGDIREAKVVSVPVLALTCGFHDQETLSVGNPEYIFDHWADIHAFLLTHTKS